MRVIRGKKALVTGAASGIGRAIALALAREGADLWLLDIDGGELAATAREAEILGVSVVARTCDLSQPAQISAEVAALIAQWDGLDILVNNAGVAYYGHTHEMTAEQWRALLSVNLLAPIQLIRELMPALAAREVAHVHNVCSFLGLVTMRKVAAYQATKFAMIGLTASLRAEYARTQIEFTALCPGFVRTQMLASYAAGSLQEPEKRKAVPNWISTTPEKVAGRAIRSIRRNRGLAVITPVARLWWWSTRLCPGLLALLLGQAWRRRRRAEIART